MHARCLQQDRKTCVQRGGSWGCHHRLIVMTPQRHNLCLDDLLKPIFTNKKNLQQTNQGHVEVKNHQK
jgi:hypothetical protein